MFMQYYWRVNYPQSVVNSARRYTAHVKRMQHTYDRDELALMEEERVRLHNIFLDALKSIGIQVDRTESEDIAWNL